MNHTKLCIGIPCPNKKCNENILNEICPRMDCPNCGRSKRKSYTTHYEVTNGKITKITKSLFYQILSYLRATGVKDIKFTSNDIL
jgi:hypothetical protein